VGNGQPTANERLPKNKSRAGTGSAKVQGAGTTKHWLCRDHRFGCIKQATIDDLHPKPGWWLPGVKPGIDRGGNEAGNPQDFSAHITRNPMEIKVSSKQEAHFMRSIMNTCST
jgi:hypothetical protein